MAEEQKEHVSEGGPGLSPDQDLVLRVLSETGQPFDAIALSSRTRLPVERVLEAIRGLEERGLVERIQPEPVHERFASSGLQPA